MFSHPIAPDADLRLLQPHHAEELFALIDGNRAHLRPWLPWVDAIQTVADEQVFLQRTMQEFATNGAYKLGIFHHGKIVGNIGLHPIDWANRKAEIGYWLAAAHQRKGLMTLACRAVITHLLCEMGIHRVMIYCAEQNQRSRSIPIRLGFTQEGIHRQAEWLYDHFVDLVAYSMLAPEWKD